MHMRLKNVNKKSLILFGVFGVLFALLLTLLISQRQSDVLSFSASYGPGQGGDVAIPARAINITAEAWGGGGGGGGTYGYFGNTYYPSSSGGGSGGYIKKNFGHSQYGGTISITVGGGGGGGSTSPSNGGGGGQSSAAFGGVTIWANGGTGGGACSGNCGQITGGGGGTTSANGDSYQTGEQGGSTSGSSSGRMSGRGGNAPNGGTGGAAVGGGTGNYDANPGNAPGGGGGGSRPNLTSTRAGGTGGAGRVNLTYDIAPLPNVNALAIADTVTGLARGVFTGGNTVTITGSGFLDGNVSGTMGWSGTTAGQMLGVTFNGVAATGIAVNSNTSMTLTVPAYAASNISADTPVTVTFTYKDQYDFVYSFSNAAFYTYVPAATAYAIECLDNHSGTWTASPYTNPSQALQCRLNLVGGPFNGTISLADIIPTTANSLGGAFTSADSRFSGGVFNLTNNNTMNSSDRILNFTYTPPSSSVIDALFNGSNGYQIYWPNLTATAVPVNPTLTLSGPTTAVGIIAQQFWVRAISPWQACVNCESPYAISTHGAPYFGTISLAGADDISNSDDPMGSQGLFLVGTSGSTTIDFSTLNGADATFTYTPAVTAVAPNYIRLQPTSAGPAITNGYLNINVLSANMTITHANQAAESLYRGSTGSYVVTVADGWVGTIILSDPLADGSGLVNGVFVDTSNGANPSGTYNPSTQTYTFDGTPGQNVRTFDWTLPNQPLFNYHIVQLTGEPGGVDDLRGWAAVNIIADSLMWRCGTGFATCQYAYAGEAQDYDIAPNGVVTATASIDELSLDNIAGGALSDHTASFISANPFTVSYRPDSPGRRDLTATVTASSTASMINQVYSTSDALSLNSYIYVMANASMITGPTSLSNGQTGNYTLTLNGPFVRTIDIRALLLDGATNAGGTFVSSIGGGSTCAFTLANYNPATNTTSCTFSYTPATMATRTTIGLFGDKQVSYAHGFMANGLSVIVESPMAITSISPDRGIVDGGTLLTLHGVNFVPHNITPNYSVVLDATGTPANCTDVTIISTTELTCITSAHSSGSVSVTFSNGFETNTWTTAQGGFLYYNISLSLSADNINFEVTPSASNSDFTEVSVQTDNTTGYNLMLKADGSDLICSEKSSSIPSLVSDGALPNNDSRWGWGLGLWSGDAWAAPGAFKVIPTSPTPIGNSDYATGQSQDGSDPDKYSLFIGASAAWDLPLGTYTQTLVITVTAN